MSRSIKWIDRPSTPLPPTHTNQYIYLPTHTHTPTNTQAYTQNKIRKPHLLPRLDVLYLLKAHDVGKMHAQVAADHLCWFSRILFVFVVDVLM